LKNKTGFRHALQNPETFAKFNDTIYEKYGVTGSVMKNSEIRDKVNKTVTEKYGVNNVSQHPEIHKKKQETSQVNYGVNWPMQNEEVARKSYENSYSRKEYRCPKGRIIFCQGYEPYAYDRLFSMGIDEDDISETKPEIWYTGTDEKLHRYFTDIYIPSLNLCIEVKSQWTMYGNGDYETNMLKQKAVQNSDASSFSGYSIPKENF
jgi:hypothetical protein